MAVMPLRSLFNTTFPIIKKSTTRSVRVPEAGLSSSNQSAVEVSYGDYASEVERKPRNSFKTPFAGDVLQHLRKLFDTSWRVSLFHS